MKIRILGMVLCLALVVSAITAVMVATPAAANYTPTTSITITRWGANSTILFQETIDYTAMQGNFTVQGNGTTHYYMEGPNFPPADPWDANETGNLKDKGALKGTDLKDLCMWAGEPDALGNSTDTIKLTAADGFTTTLPYANVYNPPAVQGPAVICWWMNGHYTGQGTYQMACSLFSSLRPRTRLVSMYTATTTWYRRCPRLTSITIKMLWVTALSSTCPPPMGFRRNGLVT